MLINTHNFGGSLYVGFNFSPVSFCTSMKLLHNLILFVDCSGHLTPRSDVYSFGVVLLELLTGRRVIDVERPPMEQKLVEWAKPYLLDKGRVLRIVDQKLDGQYSLREAHKIASLCLSCLSEESKSRPTMKEVVESLESLGHAKRRPRD